MKASELTDEERTLFAPWYVKAARLAFVIMLPIVGSIESINF